MRHVRLIMPILSLILIGAATALLWSYSRQAAPQDIISSENTRPAVFAYLYITYHDNTRHSVAQKAIRWFDINHPSEVMSLIIPDDVLTWGSAISPDRTQLLLVRRENPDAQERLLLVNLKSLQYITLDVPMGFDDLLAEYYPPYPAHIWSPDSRQFVFTSFDEISETNRLTLYDVATGKLRDITPSILNLQEGGGIQPLSWSPDGQYVAIVASGNSDAWATMIVDLRGEVILKIPETICRPVWSPDGLALAARNECENGIGPILGNKGLLFIDMNVPDNEFGIRNYVTQMGIRTPHYSDPIWLDNKTFISAHTNGTVRHFDTYLLTESVSKNINVSMHIRNNWFIGDTMVADDILAYNPFTEQVIRKPDDIICLSRDYLHVSSDGKFLVLQDNCPVPKDKKPALRIWDSDTLQEIYTLPQGETEEMIPLGFIR